MESQARHRQALYPQRLSSWLSRDGCTWAASYTAGWAGRGVSSSLQCLGISIRGLPASQSQPLSVRSDGQELQGGHLHCPSHECVPAPYAPYEAELQEEMTESCRERSAELLTTAFTSIKLWSMSQAEQWVRRESQVVKPHQPCYER